MANIQEKYEQVINNVPFLSKPNVALNEQFGHAWSQPDENEELYK